MATITFGGLATGLNTQAIIDGLVGIERRPITLLKNQQSALQNKITLYQSLSSKLGALKTAAAKLSTVNDFFVKKAKSSDENVLVATASSNAVTAAHNISVSDLARGSTLASAEFDDIDVTTVGTGTLALSVGATTVNIPVDSSNNTLEGLRNAINDSGAEVTASIVTVTAGATPLYRLVVSGKNTGLIHAVTIDESGLSQGGGEQAPGFTIAQAARDAALLVDGIAVDRASNVVSDVIAGVTLDVKNLSDGEIRVTVNNDNEAIKKQFDDFIAAYNDVLSFINDKTKYDSATKSGGPLIGDSSLRSLKRSLQTMITTPVDGDPAILADVGVASQRDGTLAVNSAKFAAALETQLAGVGNLFLDADSGLAEKIKSFADAANRIGDGLLSLRIGGAQDQIKRIGDQIERREDALTRLQDDLTRRFTVLETLVSKLNTQSAFLTQQLDGLNNQFNRNR